ncbi:MAG TPA: uroporphyrinogen decarboxylase family protein [Candidatus Eisenbacteria bacterium]
MTPRERVWAALAGERVDRPPISFWGHFYDRESSARDLVQATLEFRDTYGWDWVKLNPRRQYHAEPWGVRHRYSGSPVEKPVLEAWPIATPEDWSSIGPRPHDQGALGEQIEAVRALRKGLPADVPMLETVFTPLAILREMVPGPDDLARAMRTHPKPVRQALEAVTATFEPFVREVLRAGADGIYLATVDWATRDRLSPAEYRECARPYDLRLLAAAAGAPFNALHVCKSRNLLLELADYPVRAFSWAATDDTNPSLADGLARFRGAAMGGISHEGALLDAEPRRALEEFRRALEATGGRRWLAAPGCSIPPTTSAAVLHALRRAAENAPLPAERPS